VENFIIVHGLLALFLLSFAASTFVPLGSEWLLIALISRGLPVGQLIVTATLGNSLGACTSYVIGLWGGPMLINKVLRLDQDKVEKAIAFYTKYGSWSLLFSWLPIVGDPLCLAAGLLRLQFPRFTGLVVLGKAARYTVVAGLTMASLH
jgi:membrane protein YqaA with SNARE-associated domain